MTISSFNFASPTSKHKPLHLKQLSLYHSKDRCAFYDKNWKENLNVLKPTGFLTLVMSRNSKGTFGRGCLNYQNCGRRRNRRTSKRSSRSTRCT